MGRAGLRGDVRGEWDELKQHDVVFLLTVQPPDQATLAMLRADGAEPSPADAHGLIYVRGAEVIEVGCSPSVQLSRGFLPIMRSAGTLHSHCSNQSLF